MSICHYVYLDGYNDIFFLSIDNETFFGIAFDLTFPELNRKIIV